MNYSEASYFDGYHFQHIAAFMERKRLRDIERRNQLIRDRGAADRRSGSRILHAI